MFTNSSTFKQLALLFLAVGAFGASSSAAPVSPEEALGRVSKSTNAPGLINRHSATGAKYLRCVSTPAGAPALYLYDMQNSDGYMILPADNRFTPVLGYSDSGSLAGTDLPDGLQWWLNQMADEIQYALESDEEGGVYTPPSLGPAISPLVKTLWGQSEPYNLYTPVISDKQCPTGCVATALSQIMYYYQWPLAPEGEVNYIDSSKKNIYSMVFDGITFDWDKMTDLYNDDSTEDSKVAVATLMKAVGYGVHMTYGTSGSGATDANALAGMTTYFGYSKDARMIRRESTNRMEWDAMLYSMIQAGLPIYYTGRDGSFLGSGGHAFVCDGYDGKGYFHYNWGWNGSYNGYFLTTCLVPAGAGIGGYINGYNYTQSIMVNLHPDNGQDYDLYDYVTESKFDMSVATHTVSANLSRPLSNADFQVAIAYNNDGNDEMSYWTLGIASAASPFKAEITDGFFENLDKDKSYQLRLVWKPISENEESSDWKRIFPETEGSVVYTPDVSGGFLSYNPENADWTFTPSVMDRDQIKFRIKDITFNDEDYFISDEANPLTMTLVNEGNDYEFHAIRCYLQPKNGGQEILLFNTNIDLKPEETFKGQYSLSKNLTAGDYTLKFIEANTLQIIPTDRVFEIKVYGNSALLKFDDGTFNYVVVPGHGAFLTKSITGSKIGGDVVIPAEVTHEGTTYTVEKMQQTISSLIDKNTITTLRIEYPITELPGSTLSSAKELTELYLPESVRVIGQYGCAFNKALVKVQLPSQLDSIGSCAFMSCTALPSINIPTVEVIPDKCFYGLDNVTEIKIPEGVRRIEKNAFQYWKSIVTLELPSTLEYIGSSAFGGFASNKPESVIVHALTPPEIESNTFISVMTKNAVLKVPGGSKEAYKAHPYWSKFLSMEELPELTGVENAATEADVQAKWYTIDGLALPAAPTKSGIYVKVTENNKVQKVLIP